ncbi:MAG: hypothetical protein ACLFV7_13640, partial [Phycisphaerae bacterium]
MTYRKLRRICLLTAALAIATASLPSPAVGGRRSDDVAPTTASRASAAVSKLTGSRTRMAWVRDGNLVFFDTTDGRYVERDYEQ